MVALYLQLRGGLDRDGKRSRLFRSALSTHPILYTPSPDRGFIRLVHPPRSTGLRPHSKDSARPPYTVLSQHCRTAEVYEACKVHLRYGLCVRARPRSGSGATFIRRCFRVSVTFHTYAIATQATNLFLRQDSRLLETEQLSNHSEGYLICRRGVFSFADHWRVRPGSEDKGK